MEEMTLEEYIEMVDRQGEMLLDVIANIAFGNLDVGVEIPEGIGVFREIALGLQVLIEDYRDFILREKVARDELEARVLERTEQLEKANQDLEAFSYSISHDLRAPLRSVIGFSNILMDEYGTDMPEQAKHFHRRVQENALKMGQLIEDLLAFSKMGRAPIRKRLVDPHQIGQEVLTELLPDLDDPRFEIIFPPLPECQADPSLLKQVFTNLLSNAIKYSSTREESRIEIGWQDHPDTPAYFVRDNGVGFDMKYANKLFGVFERLHREEDFEGTGIGLAIASLIIQQHGGRIWAEAEVDQGATFYFTLS